MPLLAIALPGSLCIFFGYLMEVYSFDLLPVDSFVEDHGDFTSRDSINLNYEAVGFKSVYTLINLGTILLLIVAFPVLAGFDFLLRITKWRCSLKASRRIRNWIYWN